MRLNELTFHGKKDINYLLYEGAISCPYLLVAFQAVPALQRNGGKGVKFYNYIKCLKDINVNKLFIEDCGEYGCYYLCNDMNFDIEDSVYDLIERTRKRLRIEKENVITFGSSKGGSCALYFATKYGYGHAICGAPQTKIATYLKKVRPSMIEYMVGSMMRQEDLDYIDSLIFANIKKDCKTKIHLLTSENDNQYAEHIVPLIEKLKDEKIRADIVVDSRFKNHGDVAIFFPKFLTENIIKIINRYPRLANPEFKVDHESFTLVEECSKMDGVSTFITISDTKGTVIKSEEVQNNRYKFKADRIITVSITYTVMVFDEFWYTIPLIDCMFDQGCFTGDIFSYNYDSKSKKLIFKINVTPGLDATFAYALNRNNKQEVPTLKSSESKHEFDITKSGQYVVKYIVTIKGKGSLKGKTDSIAIDQAVEI